MTRITRMASVALIALLLSPVAEAHFPWVAVEDGKVVYFFGETPADRTYHLPEAIAKAEIQTVDAEGNAKNIPTETLDTDDFIGLVSKTSVADGTSLMSKVFYGDFNGAQLTYFTQHHGKLPTSRDDNQADLPLELQAQVIDTDAGVDVYVTLNGKPLADAQVQLFCGDGDEEGSAKTDANGKVSFNNEQVEEGLNGIMVGHMSGGEQPKAQYLTVTFFDPES